MKNVFIFCLFLAVAACTKTETRTCVCKTPDGTVIREYSHTGDKKSAKSFESKCLRDGTVTNTSSTNGFVTTTSSTTTPCELQ